MNDSYVADQEECDRLSAAMIEIDDAELGREFYGVTDGDLSRLAADKAAWVAAGYVVCPDCHGETTLPTGTIGCQTCRGNGYVYPDGSADPWWWEVSDG